MPRLRTAARALTVPALAVALCFSGGAANADEGDQSDPKPLGWTQAPSPQADAKLAVAQSWLAAANASRGRGMSPLLASADSSVRRYQDLAEAYMATYGELPAVPSLSAPGGVSVQNVGAPSSVPPSFKFLLVSSFGQSTWYYCGPTSGQDIMAYKGYTTSRLNGVPLSQLNLASAAHMGTDIEANKKATSVWNNQMNYGLNRWRSGSDRGFYIKSMFTGSVGVSQFRAAFLNDLNGNEPFAVSTLERHDTTTTNYPTYNNHSNPAAAEGQVHWIVANGYGDYGTASGMTGYFQDPMWTRETSVAKAFSAPLNSFYANFVTGRGIVW